MVIRIDARRLTDEVSLLDIMNVAFGFPEDFGNNLDALVDCLTFLDDPAAGMTRATVFPGHVITLAIENMESGNTPQAIIVQTLLDVIAFVNWRRLEQKQKPVLAVAYQR